jgi:hypothetical protein
MATKKTTEKLYVLLDGDNDPVEVGTLDEMKDIVNAICDDGYDDLSVYSICELGPKKKITFIPSSIKIG